MTTIDQTSTLQDAAELPEVREAVLRPFIKPGRGYWLLAAALAAVIATGLTAWVIQLRDGLTVAGFNDHAFWAYDLANVVTFIGVSYGGAVISAVLRLTGAHWRSPLTRLAEGTAVVTVLIGGAFIIPHLGRPDRVFELVTRPNLSSPIFWDFVAVGTYTVASIVFFALPLVPDTAILRRGYAELLGRRSRLYRLISGGWAGASRQRRTLHGALGLISIMIIPLAVSVHSVLSWAFSLTSRPWWHESIWAPYFVVAALYSGLALVILVVAAFRRAYHLEAFISERHFIRLGFILAAFAAAYLYLAFADLLPGAYVGENDTAAVFHALLLGHLSVYFWIFIVGGGVLPLLLVALPKTRNTKGVVTAAMLIVPALWLKRMLMVVAPSTYNRVSGAFGTYHFTWISVSITLAGLAAIPLLLMLLFRVVPLLSIDEIEQIHAEAGAADGMPLGQAAGRTTAPAPAVNLTGTAAPVQAPAAHASAPVAHASAPVAHASAPVAHASAPAPHASGPAAGPAADGKVVTPASRRWRQALRLSRVTRVTGAIVLLTAGLGAFAVHSAAPASAATHKPPPAAITLTGAETGAVLHLVASLTGPGHQPLAKAAVKFFLLTTEFGPQGELVPIGSATTGKNGTAQLAYRPTTTGSQKYVAQFAGGRGAGPASTRATVSITSAQSAYRPPPPKPFAGLGKVTVGVLLTIVALLWLTLATQVIRVRRVCRQAT